jgi:pyrroloquinoline-quinone synthase
MSDLVRNLDAEIERQSLLKHAFYRMWSEGKLSKKDLAGYSREYFQLVRLVPELVGNIQSSMKEETSKKAVIEIMAEETQHVEMWSAFAEALGVPKAALFAYRGTEKTADAVSMLRSLTQGSFCQGAAAMYSIESEQPRISRTKLEGLKTFYGMSTEGEGTLYFREHEVADVRHAAVWSGLLSRQVKANQEHLALEASSLCLGAQNSILDSVMETYVSPIPA